VSIFLLVSCGFNQTIVLNFPDNIDLGEVWIIEDVNCFTCGTGQKLVGRAKGEVSISLPKGWYVELKVDPEAVTQLSALQNIDSSQIQSLDLSDSSISDDDLQYISHLKLQELFLYNTSLTGKGFSYIKRDDTEWFHLGLRDCKNLKTQFFSHFKDWNDLSISLDHSNLDNEHAKNSIRTIICSDIADEKCDRKVSGEND
jgi:hypothetical protein